MAEKKPRPPWQKTGSKIEGYWAFWPFHGGEFARRFETEQDAVDWLPVKAGNKGRKLPLGEKRVIRVAYGDAFNPWSFDIVRVLTQEQVDEQFLAMAAQMVEEE